MRRTIVGVGDVASLFDVTRFTLDRHPLYGTRPWDLFWASNRGFGFCSSFLVFSLSSLPDSYSVFSVDWFSVVGFHSVLSQIRREVTRGNQKSL